MFRGSRTAAALLASLLLVSPALADPKGASDKDKQFASDLVKKAIVKSRGGDHLAAIELYRQAFTIVPDSNLLSNIGSEYQQEGKLVEALRYFCMYLEQDPRGPNVPYAKLQARTLQGKLGNEDVDERDLCVPPKPERRPPRRKDPEPEPPRPRPAPEVRDPAPSPRKDGTMMYLGVGSGVVGLAAVGVGVFAGIQANAISNEISAHDRSLPWPDDIREKERRGQLYENIQIGSLIAGGVLVTSGVILYVVGRSSAPAEVPGDRSVVQVAPTTNGFVVFGRF